MHKYYFFVTISRWLFCVDVEINSSKLLSYCLIIITMPSFCILRLSLCYARNISMYLSRFIRLIRHRQKEFPREAPEKQWTTNPYCNILRRFISNFLIIIAVIIKTLSEAGDVVIWNDFSASNNKSYPCFGLIFGTRLNCVRDTANIVFHFSWKGALIDHA